MEADFGLLDGNHQGSRSGCIKTPLEDLKNQP